MNVAFIPARCGSKNIPLKNIKSFCGKPLIYWSLFALENSKNIDNVYVGTDCEKIKVVVLSFNFKKVKIFDRDSKNAEDNSTTESVILEFLGQKNFQKNDNFVLVQATSPFTQPFDFDNAFKILKKRKGDSLLTCVRAKNFFWDDDGRSINYDYRFRPRRQDFKGTFLENGAFYINKVGNILQHKNRLCGKIVIYEMKHFTRLELDEKDDWVLAERLMQDNLLQAKNKKKIKLFLSDVDGTLTDSGMYYSNNGEELKKFNTRDGKGFQILRNHKIKTGFITSEKSKVVENRAKKLKIDYLFQAVENKGKLEAAYNICKENNISIDEVAYIGDDLNCIELLSSVGWAACPSDSDVSVKSIFNINVLENKGGNGAVREFINLIIKDQFR